MPNFQAKAQPEPKQPDLYNFAITEGDTKILAFSGKLGSGKTSCANYLHSLVFMYALGLTEEAFVSEAGKLVVKDAEGIYHEANLDSKDPAVTSFLAEQVWSFIKKYSFADPLKSIANIVLGIDNNLLYGSQEDKNTPTELKWEDLPFPVFDMNDGSVQYGGLEEHHFDETASWSEWTYGVYSDHPDKKKLKDKVGKVRTGFMTVRDVLEVVGSQIFRKFSPNCWADALIRTIQRDKPAFAIIDDMRFPNELMAVKNAGGKVVRLTLTTPESEANQHISNTALDGYNDQYDAIIDNATLSMEDSFRELIKLLMEWEWFKVVQQ